MMKTEITTNKFIYTLVTGQSTTHLLHGLNERLRKHRLVI